MILIKVRRKQSNAQISGLILGRGVYTKMKCFLNSHFIHYFILPSHGEPASLVAQMELLAVKDIQVRPLVRKTPWRREWLPIPVFVPGEFHGQRSLVGYCPQGHKSRTEHLTFSLLWRTLSIWPTVNLPFLFPILEQCDSVKC